MLQLMLEGKKIQGPGFLLLDCYFNLHMLCFNGLFLTEDL